MTPVNPISKSLSQSNYASTNKRFTTPNMRKMWFSVICAVIIAGSTLLQLGSLTNGLVIDDYQLVFNDGNGRGCDINPVDCFKGKLFQLYYRPGLTSSFAFVQKIHLHDNSAKWFHLENLLLHAAAITLAFWFLKLILRKRIAALIAGLLFAFHPVHVCVTTFIGGRTDTLALIFLFLFAIGIIKAAALLRISSRGKYNSCKYISTGWMFISLLAFTAAAFTKEQVIPLILITPLLINPSKLPLQNLKAARKPYWLAIYILPILVFINASRLVLKDQKLPVADWSPALHSEMVGRTIWYFTKMIFAPTIITLHQSTLGSWDVSQPLVMFLGYFVALLWIATCVMVWKNPARRTLVLWTTLTLFSCINIIPIPSQFASPYRAAVPLFGVAGLLGSLICDHKLWIKAKSSKNVAHGAIALAITVSVAWGIITSLNDIPNWHDEFVLMKAEVASDPNFFMAKIALANDYAWPITKAKPDFLTAVRIYNDSFNQLFEPGTPPEKYAAMVRDPKMVHRLHSAGGLRWEPVAYLPSTIQYLGSIHQNLHEYDEAIRYYLAALDLSPKDNTTREALADCYRMLGDQQMSDRSYSDAAETYKLGLTINPDDRPIRNSLVAAYRIMNRIKQADAVERMEDRFTGKIP